MRLRDTREPGAQRRRLSRGADRPSRKSPGGARDKAPRAGRGTRRRVRRRCRRLQYACRGEKCRPKPTRARAGTTHDAAPGTKTRRTDRPSSLAARTVARRRAGKRLAKTKATYGAKACAYDNPGASSRRDTDPECRTRGAEKTTERAWTPAGTTKRLPEDKEPRKGETPRWTHVVQGTGQRRQGNSAKTPDPNAAGETERRTPGVDAEDCLATARLREKARPKNAQRTVAALASDPTSEERATPGGPLARRRRNCPTRDWRPAKR
jgi:hypothetical protein